MNEWELIFKQKLMQSPLGNDPAHDLGHIMRVVATAKQLGREENAQLEVIVPAAWLHDLVNLPKDSPQRKIASQLSADASVEFLRSIHYPSVWLDEIHHAVQAHSYSAQGKPKTKEAAIVQDSDRLDALGAIGIARCFAVGSLLQSTFYDFIDPFAKNRLLNDTTFAVDHFYTKLLKLPESLLTTSGRKEGLKRAQFMKTFLAQLENEITIPEQNSSTG